MRNTDPPELMTMATITNQAQPAVLERRLQHLRGMLDDYRRCRQTSRSRQFLPTGLARLDEVLPHGGLPGGSLVEVWSALEGGGATTVAFRAAIAAARRERPVVVVDSRADLYPPALWQLGLPEHLLLMVRPVDHGAALWAFDQALRCSAVAAVVGPLDGLDEAASRRLQLAAESSGALGVLVRPAGRTQHSFAAVQLLVEPTAMPGAVDTGSTCHTRVDNRTEPSFPRGRWCRIHVIKVREGRPAEPLVIDLDDETGSGPLLSVPGHRPAASEHRRISA